MTPLESEAARASTPRTSPQCLRHRRASARRSCPQGGVLTHCNAGALATGGYGTALGVIRAAHKQKRGMHVFADETRPFLQGARLTAWELQKSGIDVTLITDNMAAHLMQRGEIQSVIVGADRIAANGDTANKIGTYGVALLARAHDIPFFVAAPLSTDRSEDADRRGRSRSRSATRARSRTSASGGSRPTGIKVRNPAFDVTPAAAHHGDHHRTSASPRHPTTSRSPRSPTSCRSAVGWSCRDSRRRRQQAPALAHPGLAAGELPVQGRPAEGPGDQPVAGRPVRPHLEAARARHRGRSRGRSSPTRRPRSTCAARWSGCGRRRSSRRAWGSSSPASWVRSCSRWCSTRAAVSERRASSSAGAGSSADRSSGRTPWTPRRRARRRSSAPRPSARPRAERPAVCLSFRVHTGSGCNAGPTHSC